MMEPGIIHDPTMPMPADIAGRPVPRPGRDPRFVAPLMPPRRAWKYRLIALAWFVAAAWFWAWWLHPDHIIGWGRYMLVTISLLWLFGMQVYFVLVFLQARRSIAPDPVPGTWRVAMITTKTPSEPLSVVKKTLEAMLAQDYPHDTWLADEDPSDETRVWCAAHGVNISTRKGVAEYHRAEWPRRTRCKEGNLAYFYDRWGYDDYDIVSQLDSDHVPQEGYLREILRPFADPAVGYVSAPSICGANAGQSWAARTRLYWEAAFHGVFQAGYTGAFTPMCIGSHYAVRTEALKSVGGLGPELAEDHSTSMLLAAGGWGGVHAIDAIAMGDGPANVADMITQEFQWSRSLLTLLLRYTPRYLRALPFRLRFLFLLCQSWYAFFAFTMALMYLTPIVALTFDIRFADVSYPGFVGHTLPVAAVMIYFAWSLKHDHYFRPLDARILSWEKALFILLQWPWVLWGVTMAVRDRLSGRFVDFRITPKGDAARANLPVKVIGVYAALAAGALAPVILCANVTEARGFYMLSMVNAAFYLIVLVTIVALHMHENGISWRQGWRALAGPAVMVCALVGALGVAADLRGREGVFALLLGLRPIEIARVEYTVSGAGMGDQGQVRFRFDPGWVTTTPAVE